MHGIGIDWSGNDSVINPDYYKCQNGSISTEINYDFIEKTCPPEFSVNYSELTYQFLYVFSNKLIKLFLF